VDALQSRRAFLRAAAAAGVAWAAADLVEIEEALAWAARQAGTGGAAGLRALTRAQADALDALTSRILPSVDGRPGAHEAGVVYFIDRALATFNAGQKRLYVNGVADLHRRARRRAAATPTFAALAPADQHAVILEIEKTPFFQTARFDTIAGALALPAWGGNRAHLGWQMLGLPHQPIFQAPFGHYDADATRQSG
jgi:gluconate 2-dehydrogenase gamma chain